MAELVSVPAPSSSDKGNYQAAPFCWWRLQCGHTDGNESGIGVGMDGKEQLSGLETPHGSFLGQ